MKNEIQHLLEAIESRLSRHGFKRKRRGLYIFDLDDDNIGGAVVDPRRDSAGTLSIFFFANVFCIPMETYLAHGLGKNKYSVGSNVSAAQYCGEFNFVSLNSPQKLEQWADACVRKILDEVIMSAKQIANIDGISNTIEQTGGLAERWIALDLWKNGLDGAEERASTIIDGINNEAFKGHAKEFWMRLKSKYNI
jgi:hypothetical protein